MSQTASNPESLPLRLLSPIGAVAIIVGIVIGAGIFKTPSMVAGVSGDVGWAMLIWVIGALISIAGALCYAELSTRHPHAGGDYHFLEVAYGKHLSFLYAWAKAAVINTGSIAGISGGSGPQAYSAAKAGVIGFTKALAAEMATKGVTVNAIAPGYVATKMVMAIREDILQSIVDTVPMKRLAKPEEIAGLAVYLSSDLAGFITGTTMNINGGLYYQ